MPRERNRQYLINIYKMNDNKGVSWEDIFRSSLRVCHSEHSCNFCFSEKSSISLFSETSLEATALLPEVLPGVARVVADEDFCDRIKLFLVCGIRNGSGSACISKSFFFVYISEFSVKAPFSLMRLKRIYLLAFQKDFVSLTAEETLFKSEMGGVVLLLASVRAVFSFF